MQVSILAGTLARLDREAPYYKKYAFLSLHGYLLFITIYFITSSLRTQYNST